MYCRSVDTYFCLNTMISFKNAFVIIFLTIATIVNAQSFTTRVSAKVIGKNDILEVEYVAADADMEQFTLPRFDRWRLISGPNTSSSTTIINGNAKQQMSYSVMLQPIAVGTLSIPGATALVNKKPTRSNSTIVEVKNVAHVQGAAPPAPSASSIFDQLQLRDQLPSTQYLKRGESAVDKIRNNILVRLEVSKRSTYVGEPVLVTYKLCSRLRSKSRVVKQPAFSGSTVIELTENNQEQHVERIDGVEYNVFVIRKVQLIPLAPGPLTLPATAVENTVSFYKTGNLNYRDLYYNPPSAATEEQVVTLENKPATIDVKPLPPYPSVGNADFSGAVGNFDISVSALEKNFTTNATNHLLFTIKGVGNLMEVKAPVIKWPRGIESFEATEKEISDKDNYPIRLAKVFAIPFVVSAKGGYVIPEISFAYFDPQNGRYVTKKTPAFLVRVSEGSKSFFKTNNGASAEEGFDERLYIILGAALLAVIIGLVWYKGGRSGKGTTVVAKKPAETTTPPVADPEPNDFLYRIRELQPDNNTSNFYKQLASTLQMYIRHRLKIEPTVLEQYANEHVRHAVPVMKLKELLDDCTLGMYTPVFSVEEAAAHRLAAIDAVQRLDKELGFSVF